LEGLPDEWERARQQWALEHPGERIPEEYDPVAAERISLLAIQRFINSTQIGEFMNNMHWSVCDVSKSKYRFLTSDRPIVMSDGLGYATSNLAVPVGPTVLFVATNNVETQKAISAMAVKDIVHNANKQIVRNAVKYVWALDHSQTALISQMSRDADPELSLLKPYPGPKRELVPAAKKFAI
jgi:hypothetical protein